ncbi:MAG: ABC transporter ATP-binding protein [Acidobacteriota bacterium]|nr:ABC transporter ATP-binding protein [Acidobacteriota bacterium]
MQSAIEMKAITKKYGELIAVDNISISVKEGEIFGLLGPNGAGKSTILKMLCGLIEPSSGQILIRNLDLKKYQKRIKRIIGVVFENQNLYENLSGFYNLYLFAQLYGLPQPKQSAENMLKLMKLEDRANENVYKYSKGMKQKLLIGRALIHDPEVLFLDEPTVGLDPQTDQFVRRLISNLNNRGKTIFITTHYLDEAEILCNRIAILHHGKITASGSTEQLCSEASLENLYRVCFSARINPKQFSSFSVLENESCDVLTFNKVSTDIVSFIGSLNDIIKESGVEIKTIEKVRPSLQEAFMKIIGERHNEEYFVLNTKRN